MQTLSNPHRVRSISPEFLLRTRSSRSASLESFVESSTWFAGLTAEEQARVQADVYERQYLAGGVACHRGDPADHWLAVIEGMVKVDTASACGRAITFAGVPAGSWFGEGAVLK